MDWKYKHFHQEGVFPAARDDVLQAARAFMTGSLGWQVTDTADGFTAEGYSFFHQATANIHLQTIGGGTKVSIELLVSRAGPAGLMLFDVGGYYSIQVRKWFDGIQWVLHQKAAPESTATNPNPLVVASNKSSARIFNGCLVFIAAMFGLYFLVTFICAAAGLITGHLYLWGRGGTLLINGVPARITSALILLCGAWIGWRIRHTGHPK